MHLLLHRPAHGLGGTRNPYPSLLVAEATRRLIVRNRVWTLPDMNRMLVERSTHPEALEALSEMLGRRNRLWRQDLARTTGRAIGEVQAAMQARLRFDASWMHRDIVFPVDESVATRLGARDLIVKLAGVEGPFGARISAISIPNHWLTGVDLEQDTDAQNITATPGRITFEI